MATVDGESELPPRVVLIMPQQWPRASLRAALREVGYDAIGAPTLELALAIAPHPRDRGPVRAVVVDVTALDGPESNALRALSQRLANPPLVLLASAVAEAPDGPWARVLKRPVTIAQLADTVRALAPIPPERMVPLDR